MRDKAPGRASRCATMIMIIVVLTIVRAGAQLPPPPGPATPQSARESAPIDLTGYWVSIVNEDWRWRMLTPQKGDYPGVPLNKAGQDVAMAWDPATDGACEAYGA